MKDVQDISAIIKSLQIIKEECESHSNCIDCPFYSNSLLSCNLKSKDPEEWELESSYVWRAFK